MHRGLFALRAILPVAIAASLGVTCASVQGASKDAAPNYPSKPIRFVIGPSPDLLARIVGQKLAESWGQPVIVDTRAGAGGAIAAEIVAKSAPDGYTWLMSSSSFTVNQAAYSNTPYDLTRDVAPVGLMAMIPFLLVVHPSLPAKSLGELIRLARAQPGKLNYGSAGNGTAPHLATEWIKTLGGIDMVHVPYKGVPPAVIDLLGNQIQLMFVVAQAAIPHVKGGKLTALAVSSAKRSATLPEMPTIAESGFPGYDVTGWLGVHIPLATPRTVIHKINAGINQALEPPEVRSRMLTGGMEATTSTPAEFGAFVTSEIAKYAKVIRDARIKVE